MGCTRLEAELAADFEAYPDAEVVHSLPGLVFGARVLGEFGDAPRRYADAKSRKNYAGTSAITRASGTRRVVLASHTLYSKTTAWSHRPGIGKQQAA